MIYKIIIPARANSKRLPGKNMKLLLGKPLIEYSIDFAINNFPKDSVWVNSDCKDIIEFSKLKGTKTLLRPSKLASDSSAIVDALMFHVNYFKEHNIACDAIILFQPTNPFRESDLLKKVIEKFENSKRNSLATFSISKKKLGKIEDGVFKPVNYVPGQRSQDLENNYFENGLVYITKCDSILSGKVITDDVYPFICNNIESTIDIDYLEDFLLAEALLNFKNEQKKLSNNRG
jgi:CMP-N-acetylneuraminic acid synthetase